LRDRKGDGQFRRCRSGRPYLEYGSVASLGNADEDPVVPPLAFVIFAHLLAQTVGFGPYNGL